MSVYVHLVVSLWGRKHDFNDYFTHCDSTAHLGKLWDSNDMSPHHINDCQVHQKYMKADA